MKNINGIFVSGCLMAENNHVIRCSDKEAQFWSIYVQDGDGLTWCVSEDFDTKEDALLALPSVFLDKFNVPNGDLKAALAKRGHIVGNMWHIWDIKDIANNLGITLAGEELLEVYNKLCDYSGNAEVDGFSEVISSTLLDFVHQKNKSYE